MAGAGPPPRRTIGDSITYTSPRNFSSIVRPTMSDKLAEMKPALLQLISSNQFSGLDNEDPHAHLVTFYELCGTMGVQGEDEEALYMRLFPFSLNGKAKAWLQSQPNQSLTSWEDVEYKFLARFFPPSKSTKVKAAIATFVQGVEEPLCEAWERFKSLLRKCPSHGFSLEMQVQTFCNGLQPHTKMILDASFGGSVLFKTADEAIAVIENMASTDMQSQHGRMQVQRRGVYELGAQDALLAQNKLLAQQMELLTQHMAKLPQQLHAMQAQAQPHHQVMRCDFCGDSHPNGHCQAPSSSQHEEVNDMGNQGRQNFFNNHFPNPSNQGWRQAQEASSSRNLYQPAQHYPPQSDRTSKLEDTLQMFMQQSIQNQKNTDASIKNLEVQVGQLAKQLANQQGGHFTANTQANPKEECNVIFTRSGKEVGRKEEEEEKPEEEDQKENEEEEDMIVEGGEENKKSEKEKNQKEKEIVKHLPYPKIPCTKGKEKQLARFKQIFDQLEITMPLTEALQQIPAYAKYMNQILSKKKYLDEETIEVQGNCSAIMQKTLPPKFKDPGSFTIPCTIGNHEIGRALVDLGASINLIPLSMLKKIGGLEVKPTRMMLQLADRSIKYPYGVVEDVVVKIDKLQFPVDFVVMDIEEDVEIPLILGRPFMKTAKVVIHVEKGTVKLKNQDEEVTFNVFGVEQQNHEKETSIEATDEILSITSLTEQAAKLVKRSFSCLSPRVKGEEEEKEEELVHQNSVIASDEPKPGKPVRFKNKLWVIKNIKINGVLEIEAPYSRRVKLVTRKLLRGCWCHDKKKHSNIKNQT
ncbi:uncharacterized protein HKW66_Vig0220180 [Vigna angularis]|uniref:Retrotransposon gag domain-containing protein n=1 Tax=Phaseolus angularis TaxID=3914 RepID=A0A8T0K0F7_PHAAN|nr:uncharacterized protein HKW66_Vig0220180 [Vigna angularis]